MLWTKSGAYFCREDCLETIDIQRFRDLLGVPPGAYERTDNFVRNVIMPATLEVNGLSIGERPMTDAERQARYRAARAVGKPVIRIHRPTDHRSRARRWHDTVAALVGLQGEYLAWLEALPANLRDSAIAESLQAMCDLDLGELQAIEPPRGFGRD